MPFSKDSPLRELTSHFPRDGVVRWIGVRPARREALRSVESVIVDADSGLVGDHYGKRGDRQVTLIAEESLRLIEGWLGRDNGFAAPEKTRRNIVTLGLNLTCLVGIRFRVGTAILEGTGPCTPCSRMEENLGSGGYNAMRGIGGLNAKIVESGRMEVGSEIHPLGDAQGDIETSS